MSSFEALGASASLKLGSSLFWEIGREFGAHMTDKNSGHNSKDSKSRKPGAIRPIETAHKGSVTSDIFASSEATHLIDQGERTVMVATLDGNQTAANVSQQSDEKKVFNSA